MLCVLVQQARIECESSGTGHSRYSNKEMDLAA